MFCTGSLFYTVIPFVTPCQRTYDINHGCWVAVLE